MVNRRINFSGIPPGNPLLNVLMVVAGALALGALVLVSIVAFLVIASVVAVLAGVIGIRLWWQRRKLGRRGEPFDRETPPAGGSIIEGEYRRVPTRPDRDRGEPD